MSLGLRVPAAVGTDTRSLLDNGLTELAADLWALLCLLLLLLWRVLRILGSIAWSHSGRTVPRCRSIALRRVGLRGITGSAIPRLRTVSNWLHGLAHHGVSCRGTERDLGGACCIRAPLYGKDALDRVPNTSTRTGGSESWNADGEWKTPGWALAEI